MSIAYLSNKKISYTTKGSGPALVLLHGYLESKEVWDSFSKLLDNYKLIIPDLPGHGVSEVVGEAHSMDLMADAVAAFLAKEKVEK